MFFRYGKLAILGKCVHCGKKCQGSEDTFVITERTNAIAVDIEEARSKTKRASNSQNFSATPSCDIPPECQKSFEVGVWFGKTVMLKENPCAKWASHPCDEDDLNDFVAANDNFVW